MFRMISPHVFMKHDSARNGSESLIKKIFYHFSLTVIFVDCRRALDAAARRQDQLADVWAPDSSSEVRIVI